VWLKLKVRHTANTERQDGRRKERRRKEKENDKKDV